MSADCLHPFRSAPLFKRERGFTLLELLMAGAVVGLLAAIAFPSYGRLMERQRVRQSARDLILISQGIERYRTTHFAVPQSLNDLGMTLPKDPWGRDYAFLNFSAPIKGIKALIRKDHNLHPLNSEFDLYSMGKDGQTMGPLTAKASRDDVIRANDGRFVGLASDYE